MFNDKFEIYNPFGSYSHEDPFKKPKNERKRKSDNDQNPTKKINFKGFLQPQIESHPEDTKLKSICINGVSYQLQLIGSGKTHRVYSFINENTLKINDQIISTNDVVLRCLDPLVGPNKRLKAHQDDYLGLDQLTKNEIPSPKIFIRPDEFVDTHNKKNGGFWISEKMVEKVNIEDKDAFSFAKSWLNKAAKEQKEFINDLYSRNLMRAKDGTIRVVDCGRPETKDLDEQDFKLNFVSYLYHWSMNGDENKLQILVENYPKEFKEEMIELVRQKKTTLQPE